MEDKTNLVGESWTCSYVTTEGQTPQVAPRVQRQWVYPSPCGSQSCLSPLCLDHDHQDHDTMNSRILSLRLAEAGLTLALRLDPRGCWHRAAFVRAQACIRAIAIGIRNRVSLFRGMDSVFGAVQLMHLDPPCMTRNSVSPCQAAFTASHLPNVLALQPPFSTVAARARVWYNEAHYIISRRRLNHKTEGRTTHCVHVGYSSPSGRTDGFSSPRPPTLIWVHLWTDGWGGGWIRV